MKTLKTLSILILMTATLLTSCSKGALDPDPTPDPNPNPPTDQMADRVEGRVVAAYVTYYGSALPDPKYVPHVMYAFAEL